MKESTVSHFAVLGAGLARKTLCWLQAGVPPLPLGHESSIFAEPNLLDHAKSMIAASQERD